jgi:hypothetical protein
MNVVKFEVNAFVQSEELVRLRQVARKLYKGQQRVRRHLLADRNAERVPHYGAWAEKYLGKALIRFTKAMDSERNARYAANTRWESERNVWLAAERARLEALFKEGFHVEVDIESLDVLDYGLTRGYESTFGQTAWGCHSSYAVRMNAHGVRWPEEKVVLSPTECTEVSWCTFWPPALRNEMLIAVGQPPVVSMDADNLAYQRELLRG